MSLIVDGACVMAAQFEGPSSGDRGADVARWSDLAKRNGFVDFLSPEDAFKTCVRSQRPWANKDQPGIYFWLAADGEAYVGQSVAPQSRLRQHWRDHRDIAQACFRPCAPDELDRTEAKLIDQLGRHFPLRNIKLSVATVREVPFDKLVHESERERFLAGEDLVASPWREFDLLTRLQARRFQKFLTVDGGQDALLVAQSFIRRAIPTPAATEVGFWSITLFPRTRFIRINAGQQEVFTCSGRRDGTEVRILTDKRISLLRSHKAPYRLPCYVTHMAAPKLEAWLQGEALMSCRSLVVRLMRHTTALNSGSHCPQAVRHDVAV
jgi:hypothetical protein